MSVRYQVKVVSDERPADKAAWVDVPVQPPRLDADEIMKLYIPAGHRIVAVQQVTD